MYSPSNFCSKRQRYCAVNVRTRIVLTDSIDVNFGYTGNCPNNFTEVKVLACPTYVVVVGGLKISNDSTCPNEKCVEGNSYTWYFGILVRSCARKRMKIRLHFVKVIAKKISDTFVIMTRCIGLSRGGATVLKVGKGQILGVK